MSDALERLRALLSERGGPAGEPARGRRGARRSRGAPHGPAQLAAAGPRARTRAAEYELLLEAIYEGYLLHYGVPRLLAPPEADLGLLAGDRLYALGLARLVALGDLPAVAELADVITLTALAHGAGGGDLARRHLAGGRARGRLGRQRAPPPGQGARAGARASAGALEPRCCAAARARPSI